jgi:hypothetical protein
MPISVSIGGQLTAGQPSPNQGQPQPIQLPYMHQALAWIDQFGELKNECTESPIFVMAAGWRSGSTLLQRLIVSSGETLIWGEPFGTSAIFRAMSEPLRRIPRELDSNRMLESRDKEKLATTWIANLYPPMDSLLLAHQTFWNTLLAEPARKAGYKQWGLKEVRLETQQITYLKWMYPKARFVFLVRNPYDAYASYKRQMGVWYETWPDRPISTAQQFGLQWQRLATGYVNNTEYFGALFLKYEQLSSGGTDQLAQFLGLEFEKSVFELKITGIPHPQEYVVESAEWEELRQAVNPLATTLGYSGPTLKST